MVKALILALALASTVHAEAWYWWTDAQGNHNESRFAGDIPPGTTAIATNTHRVVDPLPPLPAEFPSGVAILDDDGHWRELVPVGEEVIAVQVSQSPLTAGQRKAMLREAKRADRERRQAWRGSAITNREDIASIGSLTNGYRDVELRQAVNALRRELSDVLQLLRQHAREE